MATKNTASSWSWKVTAEDMEEQLSGYSTLKITKSYRGITVIIFSALIGLSILLGLLIPSLMSNVLYSLIIYVPLLFFVYKGHRWAMVILMIAWTFDKLASIYAIAQNSNGGNLIGAIIWWLIVTPYIYKALKVENIRRNALQTSTINQRQIFCTKCGTRQGSNGKFCVQCGTAISLTK